LSPPNSNNSLLLLLEKRSLEPSLSTAAVGCR